MRKGKGYQSRSRKGRDDLFLLVRCLYPGQAISRLCVRRHSAFSPMALTWWQLTSSVVIMALIDSAWGKRRREAEGLYENDWGRGGLNVMVHHLKFSFVQHFNGSLNKTADFFLSGGTRWEHNPDTSSRLRLTCWTCQQTVAYSHIRIYLKPCLCHLMNSSPTFTLF